MRLMLFAVAGLAALGAFGTASAGAFDMFRTPSANIGCAIDATYVRCDVLKSRAPIPPRPRSCDLDWGNSFAMAARGRPKRQCNGDTTLGRHPVLGYGKTIRAGAIRCTSRRSGLTCRNASGHGWFLSYGRIRLF